MTTTVIVRANHGWPVKVTPLDLSAHGDRELPFSIVPDGAEATFHVWDGRDLRIHELQPREADAGTAKADRLIDALWPAADP